LQQCAVNLRCSDRVALAIGMMWVILLTLPIPLYAQDAHAPTSSLLSGADIAFYTFAFSGIVFYAATVAAIRQFRYLIFALQAALMVVLLSTLDGTLRMLVGGDETFAFSTPLIAQGAYAGVAFLGAALNLESPHRLSRFRPWLFTLALPCFVIPFGLPFFSYFTLYLPMNILVLSVIAVQALPPFTWTNLSTLQRRWATISPVVFAVVVVTVYLAHFIYFNFTQSQLDTINRILFAAFSVYSLGTVTLNLFATIQSKDSAERDVLRSQAEQAEMALALSQAEQEYAAALQIAQAKTQQLAGASHDLKQPLAALRLSVSQLPREDDRAQQMSEALNYVEDLARTYAADSELQAAMAEPTVGRPIAPGDVVRTHDEEVVSLQLIFSTLDGMFREDARSQGIDLKLVPSSLSVLISPLAATRILTNLVANSIAHAGPSKILVGARKQGPRVWLHVIDNGVGIETARLPQVLDAGEKRQDSMGQGLGLAIVTDLARQHGYEFELDSELGKGTTARLCLPLALADGP